MTKPATYGTLNSVGGMVIDNTTTQGDLVFPGHLRSLLATLPLVTNLGVNVTSVTPAPGSGDVIGVLTIVTSGAVARATTICTVTWASYAYVVAPRIITLDETLGNLGLVDFVATSNAAGSFNLQSDVALAAGTYLCGYLVIGK